MTVIKLSTQEQFTCHKAAVIRAENTPNYWPRSNTAVSTLNLHEFIAQDAESTGSEWAVAKLLGYSFDPYLIKGKRVADVGQNIEVKWTKYTNGCLIIEDYDREHDLAVLVVGKSPNFDVRGCFLVSDARQGKYRHATRLNWWVSQDKLIPVEQARAYACST